ncbi:MAG: segregation and condensation protein A [Planctomycetota bacterium]|jgi:segregation and condensation protein A
MIEPVDPSMLPPSRLHGAGNSAGDPPADETLSEELEANKGFQVHLDRVFYGPLDLLLQLVRDKELEIHVVALAEVCEAYCQHVRSLREVDVDEAADFLVIAATLLAIKSRSLLPQEEIEADEDPFDPGEELVQQLLAYKELRRVAETLRDGWDRRARLLPAGGRWLGKIEEMESEEDEEEAFDLGDVSIWDLLQVFSRLEAETGFLRPHHVRPAGKPLRAYVEELWHRIQQVQATTLRDILTEENVVRGDAAYYLVALLELAKQQQVDIKQDEPFADVFINYRSEAGVLHLEDIDETFDRQHEEYDPEVGELLGDEPL